MASGIEAAGDIATGALIARAVEPAAGDRPGAAAGPLCLNCATRRIGPHCHACGQGPHVHRTLGSILHDLLHGVFHFEGKIWRTLPMLVVRPGELTRRYIAGERARFVSPLALFLFSVFLMFATYSAVGPGNISSDIARGWHQADTNFDASRTLTVAAIARLEQARVQALATGKSVAAIDRQLAAQRTDLATIERMRAKVAGKRDDVTGSPWLDHGIAKARANPGLILYKVQSSGYKYSWALILLSTPLVAALFLWKRGFSLYDHAIFVTYSISFMSLLVIALEVALTVHAPKRLFVWTLLLGPAAHMFVQLRGAYRLSVFSAAWRTVALVCFAITALILFVIGLFALGVSG